MDILLDQLVAGLRLEGDLRRDVTALLTHHGYTKTAVHCRQVAAEARRLAVQFSADVHQAEAAGWLHDISAVVPNDRRVHAARQWGVEVLPEEESFPTIIHQKLSVVIAKEIFGVRDEAILSAIGCHTTLKRNASTLDKVVFLADKIAWDQPGEPPYLKALLAALDHSLERAALCYLDYLWQTCAILPGRRPRRLHPWAIAAHEELMRIAGPRSRSVQP